MINLHWFRHWRARCTIVGLPLYGLPHKGNERQELGETEIYKNFEYLLKIRPRRLGFVKIDWANADGNSATVAVSDLARGHTLIDRPVSTVDTSYSSLVRPYRQSANSIVAVKMIALVALCSMLLVVSFSFLTESAMAKEPRSTDKIYQLLRTLGEARGASISMDETGRSAVQHGLTIDLLSFRKEVADIFGVTSEGSVEWLLHKRPYLLEDADFSLEVPWSQLKKISPGYKSGDRFVLAFKYTADQSVALTHAQLLSEKLW